MYYHSLMTNNQVNQNAEIADTQLDYLLGKQRELEIDHSVFSPANGKSIDAYVNSYSSLAETAVAETESLMGPTAAAYLRSYVQKQKEIIALRSKLHEFEINAKDIKELENKVIELGEKSVTDHLTALYNRRHLADVMQREAGRSIRKGSPLSVIMLDIDDFKKYNDTYGHPQGDRAIKTVADVLKKECRIIDTPFRYGGEEFLVVLPETPREKAYECAERIRKSVENSGLNPGITVSLGIADMEHLANVASGDMKDLLIERADKNLYASKTSGKNKVSF